MKHSNKVKLARRLQTHEELVDRVSIFNTMAWNKRKKAIQERVKRQQVKS